MFSSCVATLLLRWNAYIFIYIPDSLFFTKSEFGRGVLIYDIHHSLLRLLGCLILFVHRAFVPQRQFIHKRSPAPLPVHLFPSIKEYRYGLRYLYLLVILTLLSIRWTISLIYNLKWYLSIIQSE